jgi:hypothetical protein
MAAATRTRRQMTSSTPRPRRSSDHDALVLYCNVSSMRPFKSGFGIFQDGLEAP